MDNKDDDNSDDNKVFLMDVESEFDESWNWPQWFQLYPLHHNSYYDYFQNSIFYDKLCNNNRIFQQQITYDIKNKLKEMVGIEYEIDFNTKKHLMNDNPNNINEYTSYLVCYKMDRLSTKKTELLRIYYCVGFRNHPQYGSIFPMPQINMLFNNKLRNAIYHLNNAMDNINKIKLINDRNKDKNNMKNKEKNDDKMEQDITNNNNNDDDNQTNQTINQRNQYSNIVDNLVLGITL